MKPICFACTQSIAVAPEDIAAQILTLENWPRFRGYGPVPGIQSAEFELRTPQMMGTRIRVRNDDGSTHVEEIVEWELPERVVLHMQEFSPPLSRLAHRIVEAWSFAPNGSETLVTRSFQIVPKSTLSWLPLWLISFLLKRAIARHLAGMTSQATRT